MYSACTVTHHFVHYNQLPPWRTGGDPREAHVLCGWRLPSRTWNQWTSPRMKQLILLTIVHSRDWCLSLALCTH